jgi:hypothetical protein
LYHPNKPDGARQRHSRDDGGVPVYRARAEFRRRTRQSGWVLAGVRLADRFWPAEPGVEPIRGRLPDAGLLGWTAIDPAILAPDPAGAARTALDLARAAWPQRARRPIPFAGGVADDC